jgi:diguanylate cyclase (GGDEF)-like protein
MTARGRFACLLAIMTILGGTIFGVTGALGRDGGHANRAPAAHSDAGQPGPGNPGSAGDGGGTGAPGSTGNVEPHVSGPGDGHGGPGDGHGGPPPTGDGGGSGNPGSGGSGNPGGGLGDNPPKVVAPPPTTVGGPPVGGGLGNGIGGPGDQHGGPGDQHGGPGDQHGGPGDQHGPRDQHGGPGDQHGPRDHGGTGSGPGDGHDRGTHNSGHSVCSGICHTGNEPQPAAGTQVPTSPVPPVSVGPTHRARTPRPPKTTFSFTPGSPSLVQATHAQGPNPSALGASLGSASSPGATAQAAAGGLGLLAPATSSVGLHGGSANGQASGQASGDAGVPFGRQGAAHFFDSSAVGPGTILQLLPYVPTVVWIALGACVLLTASMGGVALRNGRRASRDRGQLERVKAVAKTDPLTGVLNRRGFTEAVDRELARARRHDRQFVLAYVDVRGLKAVNDTEGHLAGDELLKGVATLLTESARADDVVGRIGGDELGLLLVEQSGDSAAAVTRRIEAQVSARRSALGLRTPWGLTVGTAAFPEDGDTFDDLVAAADRRLYEQRGIALADGRV